MFAAATTKRDFFGRSEEHCPKGQWVGAPETQTHYHVNCIQLCRL